MSVFLDLLFWILTGVGFSASPPVTTSPAALSSLPSQVLNNQKGFPISELKGSIVLVDFWASWCAPCKESLPLYDQLYAKYKTKGLKVLAISADEEAAPAQEFIRKQPVSFPVYFDDKRKLVDHFEVVAVPTLLVLDRNLKVIETHRGYTAKKLKSLEETIQKYLK